VLVKVIYWAATWKMGDRNLQEIELNRRAANEREQRMREEASK
jgi:hypothetical protein